jgi:hypothetical protein
MNKCLKCGGIGSVPKHKHCEHDTHEAYIRGCHEQKVCHDCLGTGSTGHELIKACLLEIRLESSDNKARFLAGKALDEMGIVHG